jgi:hypothetical protein
MYGYEAYEVVDTADEQLTVRLILVSEDAQEAEIHVLSPLSAFRIDDEEALSFQMQTYASAYLGGLVYEEAKAIPISDIVPDFATARLVAMESDVDLKNAEYTDQPISIDLPKEDDGGAVDNPIDPTP